MVCLSVDRQDSVETWTLNRPQARNALDRGLVSALRHAIEAAESRGIDVVVLRGAGPSFCAGADIALLCEYEPSTGQTPRDHLSAIWDLTLAIEQSSMIFVCVLHGHAIAGGLELALACDVVVAESGTLIGDGHVRNSLMPGGGASVRMDRKLGSSTSSWLALSGQPLPAEDAALHQWLRAVRDASSLDAEVSAIVAALIGDSANSRAAYKALLHHTRGPLTETDRDRELDAFDRHWLANDVPAALRTFLTKNREAP